MNLSQLAGVFGHDKSYFYIVRRNTPEKFEYIFNLNPDPIIAYRKYLDDKVELMRNVTELYWELLERRKVFEWSKRCVDAGLYKNINNLHATFTKMLGKQNATFQIHETYLRYQKIYEIGTQLLRDIK